jgi:hypothetical protein
MRNEYIISPNSNDKEKLTELHKSVVISARSANERTRTILPHLSFGAQIRQRLRSGALILREDLKNQFCPTEESE